VPVKLGTEKSITARPAQELKLLLEKSQKDQVRVETVLEESLTAPVSKGQKVGTLTVYVGEQVLAQVPMVAGETVPRLTWWELFLQTLRCFAMAKTDG